MIVASLVELAVSVIGAATVIAPVSADCGSSRGPMKAEVVWEVAARGRARSMSIPLTSSWSRSIVASLSDVAVAASLEAVITHASATKALVTPPASTSDSTRVMPRPVRSKTPVWSSAAWLVESADRASGPSVTVSRAPAPTNASVTCVVVAARFERSRSNPPISAATACVVATLFETAFAVRPSGPASAVTRPPSRALVVPPAVARGRTFSTRTPETSNTGGSTVALLTDDASMVMPPAATVMLPCLSAGCSSAGPSCATTAWSVLASSFANATAIPLTADDPPPAFARFVADAFETSSPAATVAAESIRIRVEPAIAALPARSTISRRVAPPRSAFAVAVFSEVAFTVSRRSVVTTAPAAR